MSAPSERVVVRLRSCCCEAPHKDGDLVAFEDYAQLAADLAACREALRALVRDVEYLVEEGTLPDTALSHASMVQARAALSRTEAR